MDLLDLFDLPADAPHMNDDLAAFAPTPAAPQADAKPEVHGPCLRCDALATARCLRCAAAVCARHHHVMYGLCTACTSSEDAANDDARPDLDIPWIG